MGAIAGPNLIVLMLTAMEHDLNFRVNCKMDSRMQLSMQSIFLGTQKSNLYASMSQVSAEDPKYIQIKAQCDAIEAKEKALAAMDKGLEMELTKLQNELKQVQQRKEGAQKMLDQNIQGAFSYGQR